MSTPSPELDDDGQPIEPGEKFVTEAERREAYAEVNHVSPICPECRERKHRNCDGTAWDYFRDRLTDCYCDHQEN